MPRFGVQYPQLDDALLLIQCWSLGFVKGARWRPEICNNVYHTFIITSATMTGDAALKKKNGASQVQSSLLHILQQCGNLVYLRAVNVIIDMHCVDTCGRRRQ